MRIAEGAEARIGFFVRKFVRDVREPRAPRLQLVDEAKGLLDGLVHRVRRVAQCVENEIVEILQGAVMIFAVAQLSFGRARLRAAT